MLLDQADHADNASLESNRLRTIGATQHTSYYCVIKQQSKVFRCENVGASVVLGRNIETLEVVAEGLTHGVRVDPILFRRV